MNAEERYRRDPIAAAESTADGAHQKVNKLEGHLAGAIEAAEIADAELERAQSGDIEFVAPSEHVRVDIVPAEQAG